MKIKMLVQPLMNSVSHYLFRSLRGCGANLEDNIDELDKNYPTFLIS